MRCRAGEQLIFEGSPTSGFIQVWSRSSQPSGDLSNVKPSKFRSALLVCFVLVAGAQLVAAPPAKGSADTVRVEVRISPHFPKQNIYPFWVRVKDARGEAIEDARVALRLRSFKTRFRLAAARSTGRGWYHALATLRPGVESPGWVPIVVQVGDQLLEVYGR